MPLCFVRSLASSVLFILPKLRELFVELWPRNPAREDRDNRAWGEETVSLLEALRGVRARVVVGFRWESDCERFEDEYVGVGGWRRVEGEGEGVDTDVDVDAAEVEEGICRRSYSLQGR